VDFFLRFDRVVHDLISYLEKCGAAMKRFHSSEDPKILGHVAANLDANSELIKTTIGIQSGSRKYTEAFTIQLMDHYTLLYKQDDDDCRIMLIVGASSAKTICSWNEYGSLTVHSIAQVISNKIILDIIQALRREDKTVSQLSRELYVSRSTIDRYMQELRGGLAVNVAKQVGAEVYYGLNPKYFILSQKLLYDFFEKYITTFDKSAESSAQRDPNQWL
jgi:DNA-binding HxlR family transcriptional regulator